MIVIAAVGFSLSCGGGSTGPKPTGNTQVTVVMSSSANDELTSFGLALQSLTLTSQSGSAVSLIAQAEPTEFIHVNGEIEPLVTITIPQGIYTSATASIGNSGFSCTTLTNTGTLETSSFNDIPTPPANVTVQLPSPIAITGSSMALNMDLLVANSALLASCDVTDNGANYSITPTFNLTATNLSPQATNPANGKALGINGEVSSIDTASSSFVLAYPLDEAPRTVMVSAGSAVFQGINSFAGLAVGTFVNMDGVVQADGSLSATRIAVEDPNATSVEAGPVVQVSEAIPVFLMVGQQEQGPFGTGGGMPFSFGNAQFQISGQLSNLSNLPFTPNFGAATVVPGQNVYVSTTALSFAPEPIYAPAETVTLVPQTIDGNVTGSSTAGNFTVYDVSLALYDLFPELAVQQGQASLLNSPNIVEVYVDSSTQMLNSLPLNGQSQVVNASTFRFYGLVFNDHGTLRMDCAQVSDGVSISPPNAEAAMAHAMKGEITMLKNATAGPWRQANLRITPAK
jgi:Domain of unknown function (DUF5666)